ncbi:MAG: PIN domain-containing protein [Candidatus Pacearchaeota archaeon]|jgi:rRNA-processing protein FCF1
MEIIIDTNFLITCAKQKIDLFSEIKEIFGNVKIIIPQQVIDELNKLKEDKKLKIKEREAAKISIDIINQQVVFITDLKTPNVDAGIIRYADKNNCVIATLDQKLKKSIKNPKTKFITIRDKKRIILQE